MSITHTHIRNRKIVIIPISGNKSSQYFALLLGGGLVTKSCPTLCNPTDGSPPGSLVPGILQARILEWVAISFSNARK